MNFMWYFELSFVLFLGQLYEVSSQLNRGLFTLKICINSPPSARVIDCGEGKTIALYSHIRVKHLPLYLSSGDCSTAGQVSGSQSVYAKEEARLCNQRRSCSVKDFDIGSYFHEENPANYAEVLYGCMLDQNAYSVCDSFTQSTSSLIDTLVITNPGLTSGNFILPSTVQCSCSIEAQDDENQLFLRYAHFNEPNQTCTSIGETIQFIGEHSGRRYTLDSSRENYGAQYHLGDNEIYLTYQATAVGYCSGSRFSIQVLRSAVTTITCTPSLAYWPRGAENTNPKIFSSTIPVQTSLATQSTTSNNGAASTQHKVESTSSSSPSSTLPVHLSSTTMTPEIITSEENIKSTTVFDQVTSVPDETPTPDGPTGESDLGVVIGAVVAALLVGIIIGVSISIYIWKRNMKNKENIPMKTKASEEPPRYSPSAPYLQEESHYDYIDHDKLYQETHLPGDVSNPVYLTLPEPTLKGENAGYEEPIRLSSQNGEDGYLKPLNMPGRFSSGTTESVGVYEGIQPKSPQSKTDYTGLQSRKLPSPPPN